MNGTRGEARGGAAPATRGQVRDRTWNPRASQQWGLRVYISVLCRDRLFYILFMICC